MSSSWVILICEGDRPETMGKWSVYGITAHVRGTGEKKRRKKRKKRKKRKRKRKKKVWCSSVRVISLNCCK